LHAESAAAEAEAADAAVVVYQGVSYLLDSGNGGVAGEMPHGERKDHDCVEYFSRLMPGASLIRLEAKEDSFS
jgi:hypothetical protein